MTLLADRLLAMTDASREEVSSSLLDILDRLKSILSSTVDAELVKAAMKSIVSFATTPSKQEEAHLANLVPLVIETIRKSLVLPEAMLALRTLMFVYFLIKRKLQIVNFAFLSRVTLGPRIIAHLQAIVGTCSAVLRRKETNIGMPPLSLHDMQPCH